MPRRPIVTAALVTLVTAMPQISISQHHSYGILGQKAPRWGVADWYNLGEGVERIDVSDFEGKIVYLFGFQAWCPGCHSHGFPTLRSVAEHYADDEDVVFVAIQTVFEGYQVNTAQKAKSTADQFNLDIPVGHDAGNNGTGSIVMKRYRAGGTPWAIIIDRNGYVQFNGFSIEPAQAVSLIDRLLKPPAGG
ncbi:MAG: peroxiredoxin family protein [Candidatus Krumholzibacteriia bacterium]